MNVSVIVPGRTNIAKYRKEYSEEDIRINRIDKLIKINFKSNIDIFVYIY